LSITSTGGPVTIATDSNLSMVESMVVETANVGRFNLVLAFI